MRTILLCIVLLVCSSFKSPYIQYSTITSGTLTVADTGEDIVVIHEAALAATMTISLPANPKEGQNVTFSSSGGVTALTMSTPVGSIISGITTMAAGGTATYIYLGTQTKWYKVR